MHQRAALPDLLRVVLALSVAAACSSTPTGSPAASSSALALPSAPVAETSPSASPGELPAPPTSEELIAAALAAGKIDLETSLRYRAFALYADPRLPAEYQSPVIDLEAARQLAVDVEEAKSTLSQSALDDIRPFLIRPSDPGSIFSRETSAGPNGQVGAALRRAPSDRGQVAQASVGWISDLYAGGLARVWARLPDTPDGHAQLDAYGSVVSTVLEKLPAFIREPNNDDGGDHPTTPNPDSAIDIYFVSPNTIDARYQPCLDALKAGSPLPADCHISSAALGEAIPTAPFQGQGASGYLLALASLRDIWLYGTLAHEIFHLSQFSYDYQESAWLMESTATWGEFRVLQSLGLKLDSVHDYLQSFFQSLNEPLDSTAGTNEYGAYLFFVYAQVPFGDQVVEKIWERAAAPGKQGIDAVGQVVPLIDHFPKYALRTWNRDPPISPRYKSVDASFPELHPPDYGSRYAMTTTFPSVLLDSSVRELGIHYFHFDFPDEKVRSVVFTNSLVGQPDAAVQALVRLPDSWQPPRDWTRQSSATFCRDQPDQNVQELVVIISNSNADSAINAGQNPLLEAKPQPCQRWAGPITLAFTGKSTIPGLSAVANGSISANVTWEADPTAVPGENSEVVYKPVTGQLGWQYKATYDLISAGITCTASGSGSIPLATLSYSDPDYFGRDGYLLTWTDASGQHLYGAEGNFVSNSEILSLKQTCGTSPFAPTWMTSWLQTGWEPSQPGLPIGDDGHIRGTYTTHNCESGEWNPQTCTWTWDFQLAP